MKTEDAKKKVCPFKPQRCETENCIGWEKTSDTEGVCIPINNSHSNDYYLSEIFNLLKQG